MSGPAAEVAERTARESYGRLIALLAAPTGDLQLAEDALAEAFETALASWPVDGVPNRPEAWLMTAARNHQRDVWKSAAYRRNRPLDAAAGADVVVPMDEIDPDEIPERRLALLFVCAHPAIAANIRTPLMLQTVLGFDSASIARAFAVPAGAMSQRLVRAKHRIRDARIPFDVPGRQAMPERLPPVLEAIYGCYALAWTDRGDARSLAGEARYLATTTAALLDDEPEAWALASLLNLASARSVPSDHYVPLDQQDATAWDRRLISKGEEFLRRAERPGHAPGRFQLEAAIHAVHCDRLRTGTTDWKALETLYTALISVAPSLGGRVARAAVVGRTKSPSAGLELLDGLPPERERFQPYHAARGELLACMSRSEEAVAAYMTAITLTEDTRTRDFLRSRMERRRSKQEPRGRH